VGVRFRATSSDVNLSVVLSQAAATFTTLTHTASILTKTFTASAHQLFLLPPPTLTLILTLMRVRNPNPNHHSSSGHRHTSEQRPRALATAHPSQTQRRGGGKPSNTERRVRRVAFTTLKQRWDFYRGRPPLPRTSRGREGGDVEVQGSPNLSAAKVTSRKR
jgi:hypothetical protein